MRPIVIFDTAVVTVLPHLRPSECGIQKTFIPNLSVGTNDLEALIIVISYENLNVDVAKFLTRAYKVRKGQLYLDIKIIFPSTCVGVACSLRTSIQM